MVKRQAGKRSIYSYSVIESDIEQKIRSGVYPPHAQVPSENELSREYELSRMSARQALTNLVGRKLLYRVAGKGTFVSPQSHQSENTMIGLVLNHSDNPFFPQLAKTIQNEALKANYDVIYFANDDLLEEATAIDTLVKRRVSGVILVPSQEGGEEGLVARLREAGIPFVYLNRFLPTPESDYVISANAQGMKDALEYLYSLGHRKIGFVAASPFTSVIAERLECYNQFIRDRGLDAASVQISTQPSEEGGYEGGMIHLQSASRPTALVCGNDITAVGVMKAARKLRIKIPQQLSIVGYDDIELARHLSPSLTTVSQPTEAMAAMAMEILLSRMKHTAEDAHRQVVLPSILMSRESCSPV